MTILEQVAKARRIMDGILECVQRIEAEDSRRAAALKASELLSKVISHEQQ